MRSIYDLYLSYLKLASASMACAFVIYSIIAGVWLGRPQMIIGTLVAAVVTTIFVRAIRNSTLVRIIWLALNESWKQEPKAGGHKAKPSHTINTKALRILKPLRKCILSWSASERMYVTGYMILYLFIPLSLLALFLQAIDQLRGLIVSVMIGLGFFAVGAMIEIFKVVLLIWKTTVGKFVLGLLAGLITNITYVFARAEVNDLTNMDPSKFTTAVATLSVILTPLFWLGAVLIILGLILMAGYITAVSYHYFKILKFGQIVLMVRNSIPYRFLLDKRMYRGKNRSAGFDIARIAGILTLMVFLLLPTLYLENSIMHMRGFFTKVFVQTETYGSSRCKNHRNGERVAFLDDGKILVAKPDSTDGYTFEVRTCE